MMTPRLLFFALGLCHAAAAAPALVDSMDALTFSVPGQKARVELVEGKAGKALQFTFPEANKGIFAMGKSRGTAEWDKAAGISFWVKGDGSKHFGGLQFIWGEDYALRYDCAFPLNSTEWQKITVAWRDLIAVLPAPGSRPIDVLNGNAPSKLGPLWFGKWWYWRDDAAQSFAIDDVRLEPEIAVETRDFQPAGAPLARVTAKLKAGEPITIVTMGDSLTDFKHWTNREINWPILLKEALRERFKNNVALINPAIGGTQLRQNLVLLPYSIAEAPEPDLVTIFFGANDWDAGMRGPMFFEAQKDAIDRVRRATHGAADVLILTTCPGADRWDLYNELAGACRRAAAQKNAGLADIYSAFHQQEDKARLFASDKVHMSDEGHRLITRTVLKALGAE